MNSNWHGLVCSFGSCEQMQKEWGQGHYVTGPETQVLEQRLTDRFGLTTVVTNRGMTAILAAIYAFTKMGSTIACSTHVYPGTLLQLAELQDRGLNVIWFDPSDLEAFREKVLVSPNLDIVLLETIGNSKEMPVVSPEEFHEVIQKSGFSSETKIILDTTFTPGFTVRLSRPNLIILGSLTKYEQPEDEFMGGRISASKEDIAKIRSTRFFANVAMLPEVAAYYNRVIDETDERYEAHTKNALTIASLCESHPAVRSVFYPGLDSHPQCKLVQSFYRGMAGGVLYIQLKGGNSAATKLCDRLVADNWTIAVSFGSTDWRLFPFIIKEHVDFIGGCEGVIRIASGREDPQAHICVLKSVLDDLC